MAETMEHRIIRSKHQGSLPEIKQEPLIDEMDEAIISPVKTKHINLLYEHHHIPRPPRHLYGQATALPRFLYGVVPKVQSTRRKL